MFAGVCFLCAALFPRFKLGTSWYFVWANINLLLAMVAATLLYVRNISWPSVRLIVCQFFWLKLIVICLFNGTMQMAFADKGNKSNVGDYVGYVTECNLMVLYLTCVCVDMLMSVHRNLRRGMIGFTALGALFGAYQSWFLEPENVVGSLHGQEVTANSIKFTAMTALFTVCIKGLIVAILDKDGLYYLFIVAPLPKVHRLLICDQPGFVRVCLHPSLPSYQQFA